MTRPVHPAADRFPMLDEEALESLAADIEENGLVQPIVVDSNGRVIDGRNRLAACDIADVEPEFRIHDGDPIAFVLGANVERRHKALAERWLSANMSNRSIRPQHVDVLARDMEAGHWQMTGEAIKLDTAGNLIDGQHRLSAVLASGCAIQMLVAFGLAPESQQAMDAGARRSASDALSFAGMSNTASLAHAARCAIAWERGALRTVGSAIPQVSNSAVFARFTLRRIDWTAADDMFDRIMDNRTAGSGDPVNAFLNRMSSSRNNREAVSHAMEIHMLFRIWNAIRGDEELRRIQVSSGQSIAVPS